MGVNTEKLAEILTNNGYGANIHLTAALCELVEAAEGILAGAFGGQSELKHRLGVLDDEIKEFERALTQDEILGLAKERRA